MKPGVTIEQVRADMHAISNALAAEDPAARGPRSITVDPVRGYILPTGARSELPQFVILLVAVAGFALVLACANLANLLLSRAVARRREIGVRLALGAPRGRLVRQLVTETTTLAVLGGVAGVLVAGWTLSLLSAFDLPGGVHIGDLNAGVDARLIVIAGVLSLLTGTLFGSVPALQTSHLAVVEALKGEGIEARGRSWPRRALVAVQIALSFVLLVGSGLFLRTLANSLAFDPGFRPEHVALARFDLSLHHYTPPRAAAFTSQLVDRINRIPGVASASLGTVLPFEQGGFRGTFVSVAGYEPGPDEEMRVDYVFVAPDYFRTVGMQVLRGRGILPTDDHAGAPVAVVSETAARRWWPGSNAVGGRVTIGGAEREVVGVVPDAQWRQLGEEATPYVFLPLLQFPSQAAAGPLTLAVRTRGDPAALLPVIRADAAALDPDVSLLTLQTMEDRLRAVLMPQRMGAILLTLFAVLALILAAVGIYGVVSFNVNRERRSIGIRMALGAGRTGVLVMIGRRMTVSVAAGLSVGLAVALVLARSVEGFLFHVGSHDAATYVGLAVLLGGVAMVAVLVPARRAAQIDPMDALRHE
jgi:putative ABC transport system permease protein